ncbi:MAG: hypothetical protein JW798_11755 [Prolixibacteraceae bacterium]|nr:hypothetical protein [Prolixibacteraceae bacterium]
MIRIGFVTFQVMVLLIGASVLVACEKEEEEKPGTFSLVKYEPVKVLKTNSTETWAHIMPWFVSSEFSSNGNWGIHWTMNTMNPEKTDENGKRQIASHFYPLTGPYASNDPDIIEYQILLMKYSGIDGVLIDWYGSTDFNDYKINRDNSEAIINALDEAGLKFAIVYEDRTIQEVVKKDASLTRIDAAINDMLYLEENYFSNPSYIQIDGKPLLLVFGPVEFHQPSEWEEIFSVLSEDPCFVVLNGKSNETSPISSGEYIWVDEGSLDNKYGNLDKFDLFIGGAYPGFLDFYKEGGWGKGYFTIDHKQGDTFKETLQKAKNANTDYLQLITWNDYGEGTMIEPTEEFGFTLLEHVQDFTGVSYTLNELEYIFNFYELRKNLKQDDQKFLDQAFYYFVSLQSEKAVHIIDSMQTH